MIMDSIVISIPRTQLIYSMNVKYLFKFIFVYVMFVLSQIIFLCGVV